MDCRRIEQQLPAYLEQALAPGDASAVGAHLASCPQCRSALEDLTKAGQLVAGLDEVDAPPWLKTRIMARVREERARRESRLWRWLHPLGIKVPAAMATVLVAGIAVYLFNAVEPETKHLRQVPSETASRPAQAEPPAQAAKKPAGDPGTPAKAAEKAAGDAGTPAAAPPMPPPASRPRELQEARRSPVLEREAPPPAPAPAAAPAGRPEAPAEAPRRDKAIAELDEMARRAERSVPARKEEKAALDAASGYARGRQSERLARPMISAGAARPEHVLSLHTRDLARTVDEVEVLLARSGARGIVPAVKDQAGSVTAEVDAATLEDLQIKLRTLGDLREKEQAPASPDGVVAIRIEILPQP